MTRYVWAIALWAGLVPAASGQARSNYEELQILSGVLNHVRLNYVDSVTYGDMVRAAVAGLLRSLDPHSHYFSRAEFERRSALERGELGTIGVHIEIVDGRATVASVMSGGPAAERGVQAGDRLVAIDDTSVAGLDASGVTLRLAGRDGSHVRLELERGPRLEPRPVRARVRRTRRDPALVPVAEMVDDSTGYVVLVEFGTGAAQELERAVRRLEGRRMRRLILDLRQNPGVASSSRWILPRCSFPGTRWCSVWTGERAICRKNSPHRAMAVSATCRSWCLWTRGARARPKRWPRPCRIMIARC
jgi:C-terminal processing protease CtpA/Prc